MKRTETVPLDEMRKVYAACGSYAEAGRQLGISGHMVSRRLQEAATTQASPVKRYKTRRRRGPGLCDLCSIMLDRDTLTVDESNEIMIHPASGLDAVRCWRCEAEYGEGPALDVMLGTDADIEEIVPHMPTGWQQFVNAVLIGEVPATSPPLPPPGREVVGYDLMGVSMRVQTACQDRGMYAVVARDWTVNLARWLRGLNVLEIMSGTGWLAQALRRHGVSVTATDDGSWAERHQRCKLKAEVERMDAREAILAYPQAQVLLLSWPAYRDIVAAEALARWAFLHPSETTAGQSAPIVYIGEDSGGCCGNDALFDLFQADRYPNGSLRWADFGMPSWWGIHDRLSIGSVSVEAAKEAFPQMAQ